MKKDLKSITQVLSVGFSNVLLTFFQAILLTRLLTIEDRGHVQLFIVSTTIFSSFFISGAGNTIAYCVRDGKKKGYVAILATLSLVLLIGLVVKFLLSNQTYQLLFFITQVVMLCVMQLTIELLKIQGSLKYYKLFSFLSPFFFFVITTIVFMTHKLVSSDYAILMVILSNTLSSIMGVYFIYKVMNQNSANDDIPRLMFIKYYIKQYAMQVFGIVTNNMDKYLIGNFTGISALGLYSTAAAFNTLPLKFYNVLSDYLFSGYINKKNNEKIVLQVAIFGGIIGCLCAFAFSELLIKIAFGERYLSSHVYLPFIIINMVISGIAWVLTQKALISGSQVLIIIRQLIGLIAFAAIFFFLQPYGLWGAIIALMTGSIIRLMISILFFIKIKI